MNKTTLNQLTRRWGKRIHGACDTIDQQLAGRRGPTPAVTTYALIAGLVYLALESKPVQLRTLHRELATANSRELAQLQLRGRPTYRQLCYQLERLHRLAESAPQRDVAVQQLLDALVPASAEDAGHTTMWAIDTHLFEAWVNQSSSNSADPDATWRVMDTHKHKNSPVLGYQLVAAVRTGTTEVCDRISLITANADDAPPAAQMACSMKASGLPVERILADRGFTQKPTNFLDPIRSAGIHLTYDLKEPDTGVSGTYHGNLIVDGWPYSPALPKRLHRVSKPGPGASKAQWDAFTKKMLARDPYRWPAHGRPAPDKARVASPATRNRLKCRVAKNTAPAAAPICTVKHQPNEACAITTMTFTSATAPRTYQYPAWGTSDWHSLWKQRSAVERFFGHLQSPARIGFDHGRFQVRRLAKVAVVTAAFVIATNISLIESAANKAATAAAKPLRPTRLIKFKAVQQPTTRTRKQHTSARGTPAGTPNTSKSKR